jgi:hypothetical protein
LVHHSRTSVSIGNWKWSKWILDIPKTDLQPICVDHFFPKGQCFFNGNGENLRAPSFGETSTTFQGAVLLRELTWRNSVRPLFGLAGMESYSDQLEQMVKDVAVIATLIATLSDI